MSPRRLFPPRLPGARRLAGWRKSRTAGTTTPATLRVSPPPPSPALWRQRAGAFMGAAIEGLAGAGALIGAPVAAVLGKLVLAFVLAGVALAVALRFARRRQAPAPFMAAPLPAWVHAVAGVASAIEVAVLVEATRLAVRTDQPGFALENWLIVLAAWAVAHVVQARWLGSLRRRTRARTAHAPPRASAAEQVVTRPPTDFGQ